MNILNSNEAFAAMMAGRNIMCRAIGELIEFNDIDQFPANIFAKPGYEFCIKVETMELAGITFEKPLTPDEVQLGDDVYIVQASGEIHHYKYVVCHEALNQSIARGFAQRDPNNAQLQAEAFCKLFDRVYRRADIVEINTQTKQKRRSRKTEELAANDQNSTSNEVEKKAASAKKPEPVKEEAPPVEVQAKKPTSIELKKSFAKALNSAKSEREVAAIESQIESSFDLSEGDKKYLAVNVQQMYDKFAPAETAPANNLTVSELQKLQVEAEKSVAQKKEAQQPVINEIKSSGIVSGIRMQINEADNIEVLTAIAQTIRDNKPKMTQDHLNEVLDAYSSRKKFLEDQQDMFAGVEEPWVDGAIKRIEAAKNQDEINVVYLDPQYEEQSDKDKQQLDLAAQKRESELFG